jgi:hypothetical protein
MAMAGPQYPPLPSPTGTSASEWEVHPPSLLQQVTRQCEERLPAAQRTPLLLVRLSLLLQDAVEAACMCARAHIDAPQLGKHLLSSETYQAFQAALKDESGADKPSGVHAQAYAAAVLSVVGEVRAVHCTTTEPPSFDRTDVRARAHTRC